MSVSLYYFNDLMRIAPRYANEILKLFKTQGPLTLGQIKASLPLIEIKNIKYALRYLKNTGIIIRKPNLLDMRRAVYRITTQDEYFEITKEIKLKDT
ncbi:MAG: hypothetical protein HeimC2_21370 [Candidatus Heimdallarchaeota archaeon LC_2]|nr:MAG: hypothetical protein HeimC2_21370 [Candidatus Heimdallarchaeota archaeon LC_2]